MPDRKNVRHVPVLVSLGNECIVQVHRAPKRVGPLELQIVSNPRLEHAVYPACIPVLGVKRFRYRCADDLPDRQAACGFPSRIDVRAPQIGVVAHDQVRDALHERAVFALPRAEILLHALHLGDLGEGHNDLNELLLGIKDRIRIH